MNLDPRTVMILIIVGATLMGGALFVITRGSLGQIRGISRWATATLIHAAGWFVIGPLRGVAPEVVWVVVGYGLLALSLALYLIILADFTDTPIGTSWVYGVVIMQSVVLGFLWATGQGEAARTVVVAAFSGALMLKTSHLLLSGREGRLGSHALTGSLFGLCGSVTLARGIYELYLAADPNRAHPSVGPMDDVTYLVFYITATLLTFGFVLMVGHRYITRQRQVEADLRETSLLVSRAQQVAQLGFYTFEFSKGAWVSSPQLDELFGIDESYARNNNTWLPLIAPDLRPEIAEFLSGPALLEHPRFKKELRISRHSDQQERWIMAFGELELDDSQKPVRLVGTVQDITERKRLEVEKENEGRLLELIARGGPLPDVLAELLRGYERLFTGLRGSVLLLDPGGRRLRHLAAPNLPLAYCQAIDGVEIGPGVGSCGAAAHTRKTTMVADIASDPLWRDYRDLALRHGLRACWSVPILGVKDGVLGTFAFYANAPRAAVSKELKSLERGAHLASLAIEKQRAEEALLASLSEKEALLKEVHHRVKNNLALITSLIRLETGKSREPETKSALNAMQARIHSVMLLNETLYKTQHYSKVKLAGYLRQMATHLFRAHNPDPDAVRLVLELEPVEVHTDQAIPCGLIVNELMTNSLKYAFTGGKRGEVRVSLSQEPYGPARLSVSDTGVGLPADFEARRGGSLGLQLVGDLAKQLQGALEVGLGPRFTVTFLPRLDHGTIEIP